MGTSHHDPVGSWNFSPIGTIKAATLWAYFWPKPPKLGLNLGQSAHRGHLVLSAYLTAVLVCIIKDAPLISNPNRAGFLALAQFPVVFLFATKNSILSLLLGPENGYEKLNFMHRMAGRAMFLDGCIHGSLWICNHLQYGLAILGPQKETSGVASLALLCIIVLTSLRPLRRLVLTYVAFFVAICYHTLYASPWIFPPLAFYGADDAHMTLIRVHTCDDGWLAGQHVRLRVFFSDRVFESHPFTILSAPPSHFCLSSPGFLLGSRKRLKINEKSEGDSGAFIQVMLDGPYGASSVDLGLYESVFLIAGGSGVTFTLGLLDDIVGRCVKLARSQEERTRRIEFTWCIGSFGQIEWFAPMLIDIAMAASNSTIDLHISIFVTCLCDPEANLLKNFISLPPSSEKEDSIETRCDESQKLMGLGGGVAVCASGPESLMRDAQNAVARLGLTMGMDVGGIALHTKLFTL
ncbi:iron reductase [Suillus variegatus]|nr:iron reductase [Suillus variegatus]